MCLHALQRRQAEQLVEPLEQAEPHQFGAQLERTWLGARCGADDLDGIGIGQFERHVEPRLQPRQVGDRRGERGHRGEVARVRSGRRGARRGRLDGDRFWPAHGSRRSGGLRLSLRAHPLQTDVAQAGDKPVPHDVVTDEPAQRGAVGVQVLRLQHRPGARAMSLLAKGEGVEQGHVFTRHVALAVALEQGQRPLGLPHRQGGQRRQQQQLRIDRPRPQSLLHELQGLRRPGGERLAHTRNPDIAASRLGGRLIRWWVDQRQHRLPADRSRRRRGRAAWAHGRDVTATRLLDHPVQTIPHRGAGRQQGVAADRHRTTSVRAGSPRYLQCGRRRRCDKTTASF